MEKMLLDKTIIASSCLVWFSKLGYTFYIIVIIFWNISLFFCLLFLHVNKVKMWSLENVPIVTKLTMKKLLIKATKENNYKTTDSNIEASSNWLATTNRMKDERSCFSSRDGTVNASYLFMVVIVVFVGIIFDHQRDLKLPDRSAWNETSLGSKLSHLHSSSYPPLWIKRWS